MTKSEKYIILTIIYLVTLNIDTFCFLTKICSVFHKNLLGFNLRYYIIKNVKALHKRGVRIDELLRKS